MRLTLFSALSLFALLCNGCSAGRTGLNSDDRPASPTADREFRAVWVATVANIDWPDKPGLSTDEQQREARVILDSAVSLGLNAIVLQVRPHCDAIYQSPIEPWSVYLTGDEGKAPDPFYDPLAFWIEEAHNRGLELHAWFNPYRAHLARGGPISDSCIVRTHPTMVRLLPDSTYWLDPGDPAVQQYSLSVVMDVVRRYDVDGVHFDDYFYPYGDGSFPDDSTWQAYLRSGGSQPRNDWRRSNVNAFIQRVYAGIKTEKPGVKFGLSPFGIWRPGHPSSITGFDQFNGLYADARLWLNEGWMDYWTPQLYWPINQIPQSYPVLLGWWVNENSKHRHIWPGLFTSRLNSVTGLDELTNEIMVERGMVQDAPGHIHFSMKAFLRDSTVLITGLKNGPYHRPALVPSFPWLGDSKPAPPHIAVQPESTALKLTWTHDAPSLVFRWVVYLQYGTTWTYIILNRGEREASLLRNRPVENAGRRQDPARLPQNVFDVLRAIEVSAVDRLGNESSHATYVVTP
jgi:uncharacterized lipoprotein YddW (UPF0748 family)